MSCRETKYSSTVFSLAHRRFPLEESVLQEEYHHLRRSAGRESGLSAPSDSEYQEHLDRTALWARHGFSPLTPRQRESLLERLDAAREEPTPDAVTWFATRKLETRLDIMTDPLYVQGRLEPLAREAESLGTRVDRLLDAERAALRDRGRYPEHAINERINQARLAREQILTAVREARAHVEAARVLLEGGAVKELPEDNSEVLTCDRLGTESDHLVSVLRERYKALDEGYESKDPATLELVYRANRHIMAARGRVNAVFGYEDDED